jgi:hypothetical protein
VDVDVGAEAQAEVSEFEGHRGGEKSRGARAPLLVGTAGTTWPPSSA